MPTTGVEISSFPPSCVSLEMMLFNIPLAMGRVPRGMAALGGVSALLIHPSGPLQHWSPGVCVGDPSREGLGCAALQWGWRGHGEEPGKGGEVQPSCTPPLRG